MAQASCTRPGIAQVRITSHTAILDLAKRIDRVLANILGQTVPADERQSIHRGHPRGTSIIQILAS